MLMVVMIEEMEVMVMVIIEENMEVMLMVITDNDGRDRSDAAGTNDTVVGMDER